MAIGQTGTKDSSEIALNLEAYTAWFRASGPDTHGECYVASEGLDPSQKGIAERGEAQKLRCSERPW